MVLLSVKGILLYFDNKYRYFSEIYRRDFGLRYSTLEIIRTPKLLLKIMCLLKLITRNLLS